MSCTLGEMHKVCGYHYFVTNYYSKYYSSLEMLSAAIKTVVGAYNNSLPQGWEFDSNWRLKGGEIYISKLKMSNFPWVPFFVLFCIHFYVDLSTLVVLIILLRC